MHEIRRKYAEFVQCGYPSNAVRAKKLAEAGPNYAFEIDGASRPATPQTEDPRASHSGSARPVSSAVETKEDLMSCLPPCVQCTCLTSIGEGDDPVYTDAANYVDIFLVSQG